MHEVGILPTRPGVPRAADLAPQLVCGVADPALGPLGYVVVDRTPAAAPAGGGIRIAPGLGLDEIAVVARAMTLKWAFLNIPHGGAKAGITVAPELLASRRAEVMTAFGRAIRPLLDHRVYFTGPDLGTTLADVALVHRGAGAAAPTDPRGDGGMPTAVTVVEAVRQALDARAISIEGGTVAVEGFGKVGGEVAQRLAALGARLVAVSTRAGVLHDPAGLDPAALAKAAAAGGDGWIERCAQGRYLEPAQLLELPVDVLVPCAGAWTIDSANAAEVRARIVVPSANVAVTPPAVETLARRGVLVVPDVVASCGGILYGHMRHLGFRDDDFVRLVETDLARRFRSLLALAEERGQTPAALAEEVAWRHFDAHEARLERLPRGPLRRRLAVLGHDGLRRAPGHVASELHQHAPFRGRALRRAALRWFAASTVGSDLDGR